MKSVKLKKIVNTVLFLFVAWIFAVKFWHKNDRENIIQKIQAANFCGQTSDCAITGSYCIGCWNYINKSEQSSIAKLIEKPQGNCDCGALTFYGQRPICKNKTCVKPTPEEFIASFSCEEFADFIRNNLKEYTRCDDNVANMRCKAANSLGVPSEFACGIALGSSPDTKIFSDYYSKCPAKKIKCSLGQTAICSNNQCEIVH
jgi:hypothetical protein